MKNFGWRILLGAAALGIATAAGASTTAVSPLDLVQPVADYKVYVAKGVKSLVEDTAKFLTVMALMGTVFFIGSLQQTAPL